MCVIFSFSVTGRSVIYIFLPHSVISMTGSDQKIAYARKSSYSEGAYP